MEPPKILLVTGDDSLIANPFTPVKDSDSDRTASSSIHLSSTNDLSKLRTADEEHCCAANNKARFVGTAQEENKWSTATNSDFDEIVHNSSCAVCSNLRPDEHEPTSPNSDTSSTSDASHRESASDSTGTSPISERSRHPGAQRPVKFSDQHSKVGQGACKCHHHTRSPSEEQVEASRVHLITKSSVPTNVASEVRRLLLEDRLNSGRQNQLSRRKPHNASLRSPGPACSAHSREPGPGNVCPCSHSKFSSHKDQPNVPGEDCPTKSPLIKRTTKQLCRIWADITDVVQPGPIWHYCVGVMKTAVHVLKAPLGLLLGLFALLFFFQLWLSTVEALVVRTTGMVCALPLVGRFSFCPHVETTPSPYIAESAERNNDLAYLQSIASDTAALPYHLIVGQTGFKDLIFEVSAIDLPSKQQLMPHLETFNHLLRDAVDGIQDSLAMTNALVDNTILTNEWAQEELQEIEARERSLTSAITRSLGVRTGSVQELAQVFTGMTAELVDQSTKVVIQHTSVRGIFTAIKDLLDTMAMIFKRDSHKLEKDKLNQASYWKLIMASHREKMHDFDQKMVLCANFYNYTLKAGRIITVTAVALQEITANVKAMQEELSRAPKSLAFTSGSLKLAIATIGASTNDLKDSRSRSKLEQKERVVEFKRTMASQNT